MEELYKENILDHNTHPHNKRVIVGGHAEAKARNVSCGDSATLQIVFDEQGYAIDVAFQGDGCAVSQAGISMLTDKIKGMHRDAIKLLSPGDMYTMLGVAISHSRVNCALLGYEALQNILKTA
ncbi:hypothetical protein AUJ77_01000 [Candidatus Nomurabacteria bacterium CG1_02_43_90]|uniref:NIF system FeS cluster assembly NifU N-terminal domain-containing protein n=1 Tax=Candidatus Nomurabacteria bacterium CG1_02_43_90 TaxID=1805281 RepID=A0A1J4V8F0_9BACT|nr:MAG: hypothetical protein AUJ77_01000 [Candidatus Nomurabacteria bacterium CG1_02_43_90]